MFRRAFLPIRVLNVQNIRQSRRNISFNKHNVVNLLEKYCPEICGWVVGFTTFGYTYNAVAEHVKDTNNYPFLTSLCLTIFTSSLGLITGNVAYIFVESILIYKPLAVSCLIYASAPFVVGKIQKLCNEEKNDE